MIEQSSQIHSTDSALPTIDKFAAPLRRQVLDELRQSIISGRLAPGSRLVERELTAMMGVSRTVVREALRQLESERLISIIPNKGPIVRELTLAEAKDLYSIRAVLEGLAAKRFAENANDNQLEKLQQALDATAEAYERGDPSVILETKNRFYDVLFEGAVSETLTSMIGTLHGRIWRWRALGLTHPERSPKRYKESVTGLRAVLAAIRDRDAGLAERRMRDEVTRASTEAVRLLSSTSLQNS
jgi:GntR family transcriptional regulator, trigonelline degradation regulator